MSNTLDRLGWIRIFWDWLCNPGGRWRNPTESLRNMNSAVTVTDCKSIFDLCSKTAIPNCSEHRTTLECLLIRERLSENTKVRWVNTKAQLADCLTKPMDGHTLRDCMASGKYSFFDEQRMLKDRADKRCRVGWYKETNIEQESVNYLG